MSTQAAAVVAVRELLKARSLTFDDSEASSGKITVLWRCEEGVTRAVINCDSSVAMMRFWPRRTIEEELRPLVMIWMCVVNYGLNGACAGHRFTKRCCTHARTHSTCA